MQNNVVVWPRTTKLKSYEKDSVPLDEKKDSVKVMMRIIT